MSDFRSCEQEFSDDLRVINKSSILFKIINFKQNLILCN